MEGRLITDGLRGEKYDFRRSLSLSSRRPCRRPGTR
jgi:hypothetical protein